MKNIIIKTKHSNTYYILLIIDISMLLILKILIKNLDSDSVAKNVSILQFFRSKFQPKISSSFVGETDLSTKFEPTYLHIIYTYLSRIIRS